MLGTARTAEALGIVLVLSYAHPRVVETQAIERRSLEAHIQQVIGAAGVDCGTYQKVAAPRGLLNQALTCARRANASKRPFHVIQRGPGEDSEIAFGIIGDGKGTVYWFDYDSAPCGGPQCQERFSTVPCALSAVEITREPGGDIRLACLRRWR